MMARITDPSPKQKAAWRAWLKQRPTAIRAVAERFDPWSLYRMKSTGHRVTIVSFGEGDAITLTVAITGQFNALPFDRQVFGIDPNDLEPCELPDSDETVGTMLPPDQVEENIDVLRAAIRPDLFVLGENGKARRKH